MQYISLICSVLLCSVGVATFLVGMNARSKSDGAVVQKLDQAIDGIEELKVDMKEVKDNQHKTDLKIQSHEDQLKTLFKMINNAEHTNQALITIMEILKHSLLGGDHHGHQ